MIDQLQPAPSVMILDSLMLRVGYADWLRRRLLAFHVTAADEQDCAWGGALAEAV